MILAASDSCSKSLSVYIFNWLYSISGSAQISDRYYHLFELVSGAMGVHRTLVAVSDAMSADSIKWALVCI